MHTTRRDFLRQSLAVSVGFHGLHMLVAQGGPLSARRPNEPLDPGFGSLVSDPRRIIDLPAGFSYTIISRRGDKMDDGLLVPGQPDGMAAFAAPNGKVILIRNHENELKWVEKGPFGTQNELLEKFDSRFIYDRGRKGRPCQGGTTTLLYDPVSRKLERQFLSLAGTEYNCAGGRTPWGTWITCEEATHRAGSETGHDQDHGFAFEVSPSLDGPTRPEPLRAMGRFRREAIAIDPRSGIAYQTEDLDDGLVYRFVPAKPGDLAKGGKLQALASTESPSLDTRNWLDEKSGAALGPAISVRARIPVRWIELDDVEAPKDDLRTRGFAAGAARFARNEGAWFGRNTVFFAATSGGRARKGQIWKYTPSPDEGTPREKESPGFLELFIEPNDPGVIDNCDNLTIAPWGDLIVCEDACDPKDFENYLVGVTPDGRLYRLARNADTKSEFAGAVFTPDGSTLFVNLQDAGLTLAIQGPWRK
jgi:secreted PhoX family phosphatase